MAALSRPFSDIARSLPTPVHQCVLHTYRLGSKVIVMIRGDVDVLED